MGPLTMTTEHRRIHNGDDNLDTCSACDWASWDTAPGFAEHVELMAAMHAERTFWREQEAGNLPRDRGGYVKQGFVAGYMAAISGGPGSS